jgi:hypothetical protein
MMQGPVARRREHENDLLEDEWLEALVKRQHKYGEVKIDKEIEAKRLPDFDRKTIDK